jgi:hypothetical protein
MDQYREFATSLPTGRGTDEVSGTDHTLINNSA